MLPTLVVVFVLACVGTYALRRYALARSIMDIPNARSSHSVPTPRGGGVAIVVSYLLGLAAWRWLHGMDSALFAALLFGGGLIAVIGFWDDHSSLPAKLRLGFHLLASAWAVWLLGGWPTLDLGGMNLAWGALGSVVAVLALTWAINLYNFMDGIDGLASGQALFVGLAGGLLLWVAGGAVMPLYLLAAASLGFLVWNWPPAKIFMGDAGSGFLGYAFGVMALHATVRENTSVWPWVIILGCFLVDATLTLLRRAVRGIRVMDAHRTHAYQWASRQFGGHRPVTVGIMCLNVGWLLPMALGALLWPVWAVPITVVALSFPAGLAWYFKAGVPEK